jgi:hypothetical protein
MTNTDGTEFSNDGSRQGGSGGDSSSPKEMVASAAQAVKQEVASFAATAQDKAKDRIEQGKGAASSTLGDFANAIRKAGDELSQNDQSMAGRVVKQAAEGLEGLSRSVSEKRPEELLDAVRDFGRANPAAFIAGSVLVGLALGRFLRSSEQHQGDMGSTQIPSQDFGQSTQPQPTANYSGGYGGASSYADQDAGTTAGFTDTAAQSRFGSET